ncbi:MAG: IS3 family transposase [Blastocatellia bacterium]|nr:IS3 family transposase [Blastocatellia bacterium]
MEAERTNFQVQLLCRVMAVSESGYYAWRKRLTTPPTVKRFSAAQLVKHCFLENHRRYGSRRIAAALQKQGEKLGRFRVRRLMREQNLRAIQPKKFVPTTTDSRRTLASPNLLNEISRVDRAVGKIIVGDITYLPLCNGKWCYLAIWQDKVTRRIVGWHLAETMRVELVMAALKKAINKGLIKPGAIIHSDQGRQYAATDFRAVLWETRLRQSMSAKGNCYDNAQAESFFSRFKAELVEGGIFESVEQATSETFSYIEGYYNRVRLHSSLGYKTPLEFETELKIKEIRRSESFNSIST